MTIEDATTLFQSWARAEGGYSKESLVKYKDCMNSWVVRHFGGLDLSRFDRMSVVSLRSAMVEANTGINRQYGVLMTLKGFLKFCRTVLKVEALNPAEILLPKRPRPHVQYLTNEEVSQIYSAIPPTTFINLRLRALIDVLLTTGLRVSEALSLERLPFETNQREVEVVGKGGKPRAIPPWRNGLKTANGRGVYKNIYSEEMGILKMPATD
ncbi:MAG: tyrosine-type recombinase/integrase [Bryobacteraceae bacterium]|nr:tyrosine-type recombinase/integrase [Bryobacteraceae bacterium]